jgi:Flp pilus assembly protein TadG
VRRKRGARERGAAAVELALLLPMLLMVICGIIDFGRMLNAQVTLTQAAREGVRAAALGQTTTQVNSRVQAAATGITVTTSTRYTRSATGVVVASCTGTDIDATVTVSTTFSFVTPFAVFAGMFGTTSGASKVLTGKAVMACV